MKIGVLGTGQVGRRLASRLVETGHEVVLGSRTKDNEEAVKWAAENASRNGTFAEAAAFGEVVLNATGGTVSLVVLNSIGEARLDGKVLLDVSNPLDFSGGFPPRVLTYDGRSVAEEIQRHFPNVRVVKTLNTMNNAVMARPDLVPGDHVVFLSGDDADAKATAAAILGGFGWREAQIMDLGGIGTAYGVEQFVRLWLGIADAVGPRAFNIGVFRAPEDDAPAA